MSAGAVYVAPGHVQDMFRTRSGHVSPGHVHDDPSPSVDPGNAGYKVAGAPRAPLGTAF